MRIRIVEALWKKEEQLLIVKTYPKKSEKYSQHQKLINCINSNNY